MTIVRYNSQLRVNMDFFLLSLIVVKYWKFLPLWVDDNYTKTDKKIEDGNHHHHHYPLNVMFIVVIIKCRILGFLNHQTVFWEFNSPFVI